MSVEPSYGHHSTSGKPDRHELKPGRKLTDAEIEAAVKLVFAKRKGDEARTIVALSGPWGRP